MSAPYCVIALNYECQYVKENGEFTTIEKARAFASKIEYRDPKIVSAMLVDKAIRMNNG